MERDKIKELEEIIQTLEQDVRRFDDEMQTKDKSISSLQFEKAALQASVERLKTFETSVCAHDYFCHASYISCRAQ